MTAAPKTPITTTWTRALRTSDQRGYQAFIEAAPSGSYAQSPHFAALLTAGRVFSPRYFIARRGEHIVGAAQVLRAKLPGPLSLPAPAVVIERGPVTASVGDLPFVLRALRRQLLLRGVVHAQIMPYWAGSAVPEVEASLARAGYVPSQQNDGAHACTLRIALERDQDPLGGSALSKLRSMLRQCDRANVQTRPGAAADVPQLRALHDEMMRAQNMGTKSPSYFDALAATLQAGVARLYVSEQDGAMLAAAYVTVHGAQATYVLGASGAQKTQFSKMAPAVAAAVRAAASEGLRVFDLGGVPMEGDDDARRNSIALFKFHFAKERVPLVREHARLLFRP
jgi:lipid II:glycine glycyltransferase (peptidoglycan interpeptide bridge formation enzyme)